MSSQTSTGDTEATDQRYTVLYPSCEVNIKPRRTTKVADTLGCQRQPR